MTSVNWYMHNMRRLITFTALLLTIACTQSGSDGPMTVAVIPKGTSHVFWQSIHAGAEKAAQELGVASRRGAGRCARTIATRR